MKIPKGKLFVTSAGADSVIFGLYRTLKEIDKNSIQTDYTDDTGKDPYSVPLIAWMIEKGFIEEMADVDDVYEMNFSGYAENFISVRKDPF